MLNFYNIAIKISGQSVLAKSASIDEGSSASPIYALGYKGSLQTVPNGPIKNTINLEYIVEPRRDVSQILVDKIRNYDFNSFPTQIIIAGKTGMGYLNSYSLNISPNDVIIVSVQYDVFTPMTGSFTEQNRRNFYTGNYSGLGHYSTCYAKSSDGSTTGSVLQANYSFQNNWQPIYKIGNPVPIQVKLMSATEQFNFSHEYTGIKITHSGTDFRSAFPDFSIIEINPLSADWGATGNSIKLYLSSGEVIKNTVNIQENNLIINETSIIKYY